MRNALPANTTADVEHVLLDLRLDPDNLALVFSLP